MDSIYQLRYRDVLMLCVFALLALGLIMVQSAAAGVSGQISWTWSATGSRGAIYVAISVAAFLLFGFTDYRRLANPMGRSESPTPARDVVDFIGRTLRTPATWGYLIGVTLCLLVLIPGIGKEVNGARRWIQFGPIQLQASEAGKWGCVLLFAWMLAVAPGLLKKLPGFVAALVPLGVVGLLVVKEDFGTAALIGLCVLMILVVAGTRLWHLAMFLPPMLAGAWYFVASEPYRLRRIAAFTDPFAAPEHEGYHLIQSLLSFASGGALGRGLGNGVQKLGYLPEDTTDFIFAIICEELGIAGAALTVLLYLGIIWSCWNIMKLIDDRFGKLLVFGVGCMVGTQAMLNIAVATVSVPPKGLPLPLVSFGGTGLVITSIMLGLVYSVARSAESTREAGMLKGEPLAQAA